MNLLNLLRWVFQRRSKPAVTSDGIALGYGIEKLDIVPGAARRSAALQARMAAERMTESERDAHIQTFGTPAEKELMATLRKQRADNR